MNKIAQRFQKFFESSSAAGIILIIATLLAVLIANSPFHEQYKEFMDLKFIFGFENINISKSIHHWVNDGLMSIFFLLVGLEIKRELKFGRLNSYQSALFPVAAAISGAIFPALIFYFLNTGTEYMDGWAIPMATDIAFVLGILAVVGPRVPIWVKVFVTTIAVVDDLIAVLVIAFFYTETLNYTAITIAILCIIILVLFNKFGVVRLSYYLSVGFILWWAVLASGIHATIAGVIIAFTLPLHRAWSLSRIRSFARKGLELFKKAKDQTTELTLSEAHYYIDVTHRHMESPLNRLERKLHKTVYFFIMPLFAFVNAGIRFDSEIIINAFYSPLTWGIILGLGFGKILGILFAVFIMLKYVFKDLPNNKVTWQIFIGLSLLCGIGFTMSLFITNLSYDIPVLQEYAKIGILCASLVCGVLGYLILRNAVNKPIDQVQNPDMDFI